MNETGRLLVDLFLPFTAARVVGEIVAGAGLLVTAAAIVGKLLGCGLAALPLGRRNAAAVGVGMIPCGEVGMVVALIGLSRRVITNDTCAVIVLMAVLTSLLAPPVLRVLLMRSARVSREDDNEDLGLP